jgi:ATP-dependent Lon protease
LEILDPEQNSDFNDHYLEVGYDLSKVLFVATANSLNMHPALLDRMEVVRISGYTEKEKLEIARTHLLPRQLELHGLRSGEFEVSNDAIRLLIRQYCREAGVRNLERELANLVRKALKEILRDKKKAISVDTDSLKKYAGVPRYRSGSADLEDVVGITHGLAWTEVGGELLSIEALMIPGKGKIMTTGKLGEVMQESIQAASSFIRSRSPSYGIRPPVFENHIIHVHVPEGAIPKDGPSAGVAMCTSIVSVLTGIPVKGTVAMTGEISLRGRVLPIGGLKEKILAALAGGIQKVLIPEENIKDLENLPDDVKNSLEIVPVATVDQVLEHALVRKPQPIEWPTEEGLIPLPHQTGLAPLSPSVVPPTAH